MNLPDTVLREPYGVFAEGARKRRITRNGSLARRCPLLTPEKNARLRVCMGELPKTVCSTAQRGGESTLGGTRVTELRQERHAFLHAAGSRQAALLVEEA